MSMIRLAATIASMKRWPFPMVIFLPRGLVATYSFQPSGQMAWISLSPSCFRVSGGLTCFGIPILVYGGKTPVKPVLNISMKLHDLLESTLNEAPLGDYNVVGNWDKAASFRKEVDRNLVTNPRMIERVFKAFQNTDYDFQFFMVNIPGAGKHAEVGSIGRADNGEAMGWIQENLPKLVPEMTKLDAVGKGLKEDSINVIFTNNLAAEHAPMTPWIMAHRIAHTMRRNPRNSRGGMNSIFDMHYEEAYDELVRMTGDILEQDYQIRAAYVARRSKDFSKDNDYGLDYQGKRNGENMNRSRSLIYTKFWEAIGTFRSARDGNLRQEFEMVNELMAQYLIQGGIKFNPAPVSIKVALERGYGPGSAYLSLKNPDDANAALNSMANTMDYYFSGLLGANVGNVYVM